MDPLAEKYPGWSPYNYSNDNPIAFIDPNGEYTTFYSNGWLIYRQWTIAGAINQLGKENWPIFGYLNFLQRAMINDPSFSPSGSECVQNIPEAILDAYSVGLAGPSINIGVAAYNIASSGLTRSQLFRLEWDERTFNIMLKTTVEGYPLTMQVEHGVDLKIAQTVNDPRMITLHSILRKKWKKERINEKGDLFNDEDCNKEFAKQFEDARRDAQDQMSISGTQAQRHSRYDASNR